MNAIAEVTTEMLQAFAEAWNRHDIDALMQFMTEDCVFEASAGPEPCGTRYVGPQAVREAFSRVWHDYPPMMREFMRMLDKATMAK